MLKINNLYFSSENKIILNSLNFSVDNGEIIGIIGPAGSGKTLLLKILAGLQKSYKGKITLNTTPLKSFSNKEINKNISYFNRNIPENTEETLYDYLMVSRKPLKKLFSPFSLFDRDITEQYIESFKLEKFRNIKIKKINQSTLRTAQLAFTLIKESGIVLMDNPTSDLEISHKCKLRKVLIKYVMNGNRSVIICSNDLNFILQLTDRIILINNGEIAEQGKPDFINSEVIKKYFNIDVLTSKNIYNGKPEIHVFPES